jgi:hypothetical protein
MKVFLVCERGVLGRDSLRASVSRLGGCRAGLGRNAAREAATVMMTEVRGASKRKAKRELGWSLRSPSRRRGFARGLG